MMEIIKMIALLVWIVVGLLSRKSTNISLEPGVFEEFCLYAGPLGIKPSAWVNAKMKDFIEEQRIAQADRIKARDRLPQIPKGHP
jgi:hypothetical protein